MVESEAVVLSAGHLWFAVDFCWIGLMQLHSSASRSGCTITCWFLFALVVPHSWYLLPLVGEEPVPSSSMTWAIPAEISPTRAMAELCGAAFGHRSHGCWGREGGAGGSRTELGDVGCMPWSDQGTQPGLCLHQFHTQHGQEPCCGSVLLLC